MNHRRKRQKVKVFSLRNVTTSIVGEIIRVRRCLVCIFKQLFSVFK